MWLKKKPKKVRVKCKFCKCEFNMKRSMWKHVDDSYRYVTEEEKNYYMKLGVLLSNRTRINYKYMRCPVCNKCITFDEEIQWTK